MSWLSQSRPTSSSPCTGWLKKSKLLYCVNSLLFLSHPVYNRLSSVGVAMFCGAALLRCARCALKQARDKEKKEKKEKTTKDKEKEKEEAAPPAAEAAAPPPAADDEDKPSETKKDEPKKKIGNVFALFNQSQIQEFKEVRVFIHIIYTMIFVVNDPVRSKSH